MSLAGFCLPLILTAKEKGGTELGMYYVYILFSEVDRMLYTGSTKDLRQRWRDHCAGRADATKYRRPLRLIYYEAYPTKLEAERRERYLKGGNGREQLKKQLFMTLKKFGYRFQ